MKRSTRIHVLSPVAGTGNRLDLELVCPLLEQNGFEVTPCPVADRRRSARHLHLARRLLGCRGRFDVNLFLGPLFPEWLPFARTNVWMPNPEGFHEHERRLLPRIGLVLAKTRLTEHIFRGLGRPTAYTGFTSRDRFDGEAPRSRHKFFHAGSSPFKGTARLLEAWKAHPEWPELVAIVHDEKIAPGFRSPNVRLIREYLPDAELRQYQNGAEFHLCCSETEGFGHYIMEALSCGAVVFTTDAPPMNELARPPHGILVDCLEEAQPVGLGRRHLFRAESLELQIEMARGLDPAGVREIGASARAFFLENDRLFRQRFLDTMRSL